MRLEFSHHCHIFVIRVERQHVDEFGMLLLSSRCCRDTTVTVDSEFDTNFQHVF